MPAIHGPKAINVNGQITVPTELLKECGLRKGDHVYLRLDERRKATILILPGKAVEEVLDRALHLPGKPPRGQ